MIYDWQNGALCTCAKALFIRPSILWSSGWSPIYLIFVFAVFDLSALPKCSSYLDNTPAHPYIIWEFVSLAFFFFL